MPLLLILAALLLGDAFSFDLLGREFTVSFIDLAAAGIGVSGAVVAWRRRRVRVDLALLAYGGVLAVLAVQALALPGALDILGGSSRFASAALILFGLSQLVPGQDRAAGGEGPASGLLPWRWTTAVGLFGVVLAVWAALLLAGGLLDPARTSFYDVKKAVVMPLGASNFLAAFALVSAAVTGARARVDRRFLPVAGVCVLGVLATLSRGAVLAAGGALAVAPLLGRADRWVAARALGGLAALAVAGGVVLGAVVAPRFLDASGPPPQAAAPGGEAPGGSGGQGDPAPSPGGLVGGEVEGRMTLYAASWEAFRDRPLLGVGLNRLVTVTAPAGEPHPNAHNMVLHLLATTGLAGALAYGAVWATLLLRVVRLPAGPGRSGLLLGLLALLLHAQIEALATTRPVEALLATLVALAGAGAGTFATRELPLPRRTGT